MDRRPVLSRAAGEPLALRVERGVSAITLLSSTLFYRLMIAVQRFMNGVAKFPA